MRRRTALLMLLASAGCDNVPPATGWIGAGGTIGSPLLTRDLAECRQEAQLASALGPGTAIAAAPGYTGAIRYAEPDPTERHTILCMRARGWQPRM